MMENNSITKYILLTVILLLSIVTLSFEQYQEWVEPPRFTESGLKLNVILSYYSTIPQYRMITYYGRKITYCNIFARDVLDNREYLKYKKWFGMFINEYAYDLSTIFPKTTDILITKIDTAYWRALYAKKKGWIKELTPYQAQKRANEGVPIWIVTNRYTHEAIVCPDIIPYHSERGVLLAQAGESNGVFYARDARAFGNRYLDKEIKYYEFPERKN